MGSLDERKLSETGVATDFSKEDAILYVNGKRYVLPPDAAHRTLLEYLRGWFHSIHFASRFRNSIFPVLYPLSILSCQTFALGSIGFDNVAVLLNNMCGWGVTSLMKDVHNTSSSSSAPQTIRREPMRLSSSSAFWETTVPNIHCIHLPNPREEWTLKSKLSCQPFGLISFCFGVAVSCNVVVNNLDVRGVLSSLKDANNTSRVVALKLFGESQWG